ncbi:MAG: DUF4159 domain-containing protein [Pseudomonadota bacterium]
MLSVGALAFLNPWLLAALAALPVLWWLLRATPPAPRRLSFPGVRLLLGLEDPERMPDKTPWWLLLLRILAIAAAILAFARPVLNPSAELGAGSGPVLVLMDAGWASAPDWEARRARAAEALDQAERAGRPAVLQALAATLGPERLDPRPAGDWRGALEALAPSAWAPDRGTFIERAEALAETQGGFETIWISDGLEHGDGVDLAESLSEFGPVTVVAPASAALGLRPPTLSDGVLVAVAARADPAGERPVSAVAVGRGPDGAERRLAIAEGLFEDGETEVELAFELPLELRNQVERVALSVGASAGGVALADDAVRRKRVGLISGEDDGGSRPLTSQLHFLRKALEPTAEVIEGDLSELLEASPDAMVLADLGTIPEAGREALAEWMETGGLLVRFAGPRTARAETEALRDAGSGEDPLLPVRLRAGGRAVGGAMSWGAPQALAPFPEDGLFAGLDAPQDVQVTRQVLAQPGPDVAERTLAALADGTPLVTAADRGDGRVVFFHVTANAEWSSLPLSGLFVQMLERLALAASTGGPTAAAALEDAIWTPVTVLDGFGRPSDPGRLAGVEGARLAEAAPAADAPPGVYRAAERAVAFNLLTEDSVLQRAEWPAGIRLEGMERAAERDFKGLLLAISMVLLAIDALAAMAVAGRLRLPRRGAAAGLALLAATALAPGGTRAQTDEARALAATTETVLAYVLTGDPRVDDVTEAGLRTLSRVLSARTAVEPAEPIGVNLETDELAFYPMLYWPVTEDMPTPSDAAYERLNAFTRTGGMIVFDTRDAHLATGFGAGTAEGRALRRLAGSLDLPPVEPSPSDHVITRTFYLLQEFPGRWSGGDIWLEAAIDADEIEGAPFRNLNDGVSPVIIGGSDWAAAWAHDPQGQPLAPVGVRQREMAFRFGVNLVMYVLTGSYKSDQVHVPALLERLGN